MDRRRFLLASAAASALGGCSKLSFLETTPAIGYPGMREGHLLRDGQTLPPPSAELSTEVVILGSGVAALTTAWKLAKEGFHEFVVVSGPEFGGNASAGQFGELAYPRGAHYLPLPSMESAHVREMLFDLGVIIEDPMQERPYFDEACIVHSPEERLYFQGKWQEDLLPTKGVEREETAQQARFLQHVEGLKTARGSDGKKVFSIPMELASTDPGWLELDRISFRQWLDRNGHTARTLHWYLNYCCRDDYGAEYDKVSAWAGLHFFASRSGHARNASDGAVLTWPDGLHSLVRKLAERIEQHHAGPWQRPGTAARLEERPSGVEVVCATDSATGPRTFLVKAKRAVCAMPLFAASRVVTSMASYGFDQTTDLPSRAPWLVSNFLMNGFPAEEAGAPLAWDNVIYQGPGLGYVVSTHQNIRVAAPPKTVFSAYQTLSGQAPATARKWLARASAQELYEESARDLKAAYGLRLWQHTEALDITVRGHAMASPLRGFLSNKGLTALRRADGKVLFAHSDLSGFSVFEEAAWWGYKAAKRILS
jgi:hypothetical protein